MNAKRDDQEGTAAPEISGPSKPNLAFVGAKMTTMPENKPFKIATLNTATGRKYTPIICALFHEVFSSDSPLKRMSFIYIHLRSNIAI